MQEGRYVEICVFVKFCAQHLAKEVGELLRVVRGGVGAGGDVELAGIPEV